MKVSARNQQIHNLMVHGINILLERKLISLNGDKGTDKAARGYVVDVIGGYRSVIAWEADLERDLQIIVWFDFDGTITPECPDIWFTEETKKIKPQEKQTYASVMGSCMFSRDALKKAYIWCIPDQGGMQEICPSYVRQKTASRLKNLPQAIPFGYDKAGRNLIK